MVGNIMVLGGDGREERTADERRHPMLVEVSIMFYMTHQRKKTADSRLNSICKSPHDNCFSGSLGKSASCQITSRLSGNRSSIFTAKNQQATPDNCFKLSFRNHERLNPPKKFRCTSGALF